MASICIFPLLAFFFLLLLATSQARFPPAEHVTATSDLLDVSNSRPKILLPSERSSESDSNKIRPAFTWRPIKRRFDWMRVIRRSFAVHNRHRGRHFEVEAQIRPINEEEKYLVKGERHHRHSDGGRAAIGEFRHRRFFHRRHRHHRSHWRRRHRKEDEIEAHSERKKIQKLLAGL